MANDVISKPSGYKHGESGRSITVEYRSWHRMRERCFNPNYKRYADYGGRGITVCDAWHDFATFLADVGRKPSPKHTLERIDNARGYEPGNVIWATPQEQAANRRNTIMLGDAKLADLARRHGISPRLLWVRITRDGWPLEKALQPAGPVGSGGTQIIVTCPHCGHAGNIAIMTRWHFDNCKNKPRV